MSTHIPSFDHRDLSSDPVAIAGVPPEELLAQAWVSLRAPVHNALVMIGTDHRSNGVTVVGDILELASPHAVTLLEERFMQLRERGINQVHALIVHEDGYENGHPQLLMELSQSGAALILTAAASIVPEPFDCPWVWSISGGQAHLSMITQIDSEGIDLVVSPPVPMLPLADTRCAARAVINGVALPRDRSAETESLCELVRSISDQAKSRTNPHTGSSAEVSASAAEGPEPSPLDEFASHVRERAEQANHARNELIACGQSLDPARVDTHVHTIAAFIQCLAQPDAVSRVISLMTGQNAPTESVIDQLARLTADPRLTPPPDVQTGSEWINAATDFAALAEQCALPVSQREQRAAWRTLTLLRAITEWWSHRFATAGRQVDQLALAHPADPVIAYVAHLINTPVPAAWWHDPGVMQT